MQAIHHQKGMATILLVLLIGISVMLITASVAKTLTSKKDASVAAHAQTNAQLMGWAGVSAFREYLLQQGKINVSKVADLHGKTLPLRYEANSKEIIAQNIRVSDCTAPGTTCVVTADISSNNMTAKAATTIQAVYELTVKNGQVTALQENLALNFTGTTFMSGTEIKAETPNSQVTLNVDGNTSIQAGFKTRNISQLTINSTGDVIIDCSTTRCGNTKIDINARGNVHITNPGNFGEINAKGWVKLQTGVNAENISSLSRVHLALNSTAKTIQAQGEVEIAEGSSVQNIYSNDKVILRTNAKANTIQTHGAVSVSIFSKVYGNIESGKQVDISNSEVTGDVKAYDYVDLDTNAKVNGSVYAKGLNTISLTNNVAVRLSTSWIGKNVYANKNLRLLDGLIGKDIEGSVYLTGEVIGIKSGIKGSVNEKQKIVPGLDFTIPRTVDTALISQRIDDKMNFSTKVDVRVYKYDANYIFTKKNGISYIYLNYLQNKSTNITYLYQDNKQYAVAANGTKTLVSERGFAIGDYSYGGKKYIGAICLTASNGTCTSPIISYLPRISVGKTLGVDNDYDYLAGVNTWHIRTTSEASPLDNAAFAPGIFYFEGKLILTGHTRTGTFTNTFLAEEDIDAVALSPYIYSPYNVLRNGSAALICDRPYKTVTGTTISGAPLTQPATESNRYLTPTNLCKSANEFAYRMGQDASGNSLMVTIDGTAVKKLDLGYVALMSNRVIRVGTCAQVYGDVYARSTVENSSGCSSGPSIVGAISTQGKPPYTNTIQQQNTFGAGSNIVVPRSEFIAPSNKGSTAPSSGSTVENVLLKWSKYI